MTNRTNSNAPKEIQAREAQVEGNELTISSDGDEEGSSTVVTIPYAGQTCMEELQGGGPTLRLMHLSNAKDHGLCDT